jgi:hypothetical protein
MSGRTEQYHSRILRLLNLGRMGAVNPERPEMPLMIDQKPRRLVRSFHATVKPIGSRCNIDCTYCYYLHKQGLLNDTKAGKGDK